MPTLYVVATPIGNLEDVTLRAIRILKEVDLILCEDTRVTKRLLMRYEIDRPTMSYHAQSKLSKAEKIIALLAEGKNLALVSDAGTPTISDPGCLLVAQVRAKFGDVVNIIPVPGPSAVLAALSISGFPSSEFIFLGFLPHKKGRETMFKEIAISEKTIVFYESPHRIMKALESLKQHLGPKRRMCVSREITKIHEEHVFGMAEEVLAHFTAHPDRVRGEFVVIEGDLVELLAREHSHLRDGSGAGRKGHDERAREALGAGDVRNTGRVGDREVHLARSPALRPRCREGRRFRWAGCWLASSC